MSQTQEIKSVVLKLEERSAVQRRAKLAGIMRGAGSIELTSSGVGFVISTENQLLINKATRLIKLLYDLDVSYAARQSNLHEAIYEVFLVPPKSIEIMKDLKILYGDGGYNRAFTEDEDFADITYVTNFVAGMFLACGSVYLPDEKRSGYHLEFVFSNEDSAEKFSHILAELNFMPKKVARKGSFVVYLKESEAISDFFASIGASGVVLKLQDIKAQREVTNLANRQSNCISANIDKAVEASLTLRAAIATIDESIGLDNLPETLMQAAKFRLDYPDETLSGLAQICGISKSGLNHRFRKIISIANELGGK